MPEDDVTCIRKARSLAEAFPEFCERMEVVHNEAARCLRIQGIEPGTSSDKYGYGLIWKETGAILKRMRGES